ncbi:FAD/NAD(P)-binding domain-containing protein [Corynespora cassiicola Philippines]|uniref:FAD/NAD(P)-binding domain-containing protein n=1 Tax=Corynespora cassiicola Philippines TaxID=1448308 RepID=A0A2T2P9M2_CORCC|nr:FAD/NAD(P)-binding domain-containing protein [Corynespora cassiicola Philippines]
MSEEHVRPLNVIIAGAGIGGLSAAIFLRQQGHHVTLLEQSRFANELGAAVHLAPNANGLLRRMGLDAQSIGSVEIFGMSQYKPDGSVVFNINLTEKNKRWQHPWLLAHRVSLHNELKQMATTEKGKGKPAVLKTRSRVQDCTTDGVVTLASGEKLEADLIVGADGVHSRTRYGLPGSQGIKTFGSGKSAFRFLLRKEKALSDPETAKYVKDGHMSMIFGRDRRVIIYSTSDNEILNFNCIHPSSESEADVGAPGDWQQTAKMDKLLQVYKDFDPALVKLLAMAEEETLKVWELLDMDQLPTWTEGRLVCIGDAAHPFTPHQGQGAGQAIEDAASLAAVLPSGVPASEIADRLKIYEKCRYERASKIQEYSRMAGRDLGSGPPLDINEYTGYNFGHDEWDYSSQKLREWEWSRKKGTYWRSPISFGPMPGPRQDSVGNLRDGSHSTFRTASIRFQSSRTVLQNLLPTTAFKFADDATVVEASFSVTTLDNLDWLGGKGYSHFGLYIHGIQYKDQSGNTVQGTYLPVLFENLSDPIVSGREELGMPKVYCDMEIVNQEKSWKMGAGWLGSMFCEMSLEDLQEPLINGAIEQQPSKESKDEGLLWYKYIPKTGALGSKERGEADVAHPVFLRYAEEAKSVDRKVERSITASNASIKFDGLDWKRLPTLHHIVERLADIPVYSIVEAKVVEGQGVSDVRAAGRV